MGAGGGDFLDVVGDKDDGGGWAGGESGDELEEPGAGYGVETGTGFVEDEEVGLGDEGAGDEDALAFALAEDGPWAGGEV
jgi:hypothetical protein